MDPQRSSADKSRATLGVGTTSEIHGTMGTLLAPAGRAHDPSQGYARLIWVGHANPSPTTSRARGGMTITRPDMKDYFVAIPNAAVLVLDAKATGPGGEIFVSAWANRSGIVELERSMIELADPQWHAVDIELAEVRPGERALGGFPTDGRACVGEARTNGDCIKNGIMRARRLRCDSEARPSCWRIGGDGHWCFSTRAVR
jgi:hypothetical protein